MSDGMTDVARDHRRNDAMNVWLKAVVEWIERGTGKNLDARRAAVDAAADAVEGIPGGYWQGQARGFRAHSDKVCAGLRAGDPATWGEFLTATDEAPDDLRKRIKKCAPKLLRQGQRDG